jgi:hypothetical protein
MGFSSGRGGGGSGYNPQYNPGGRMMPVMMIPAGGSNVNAVPDPNAPAYDYNGAAVAAFDGQQAVQNVPSEYYGRPPVYYANQDPNLMTPAYFYPSNNNRSYRPPQNQQQHQHHQNQQNHQNRQ